MDGVYYHYHRIYALSFVIGSNYNYHVRFYIPLKYASVASWLTRFGKQLQKFVAQRDRVEDINFLNDWSCSWVIKYLQVMYYQIKYKISEDDNQLQNICKQCLHLDIWPQLSRFVPPNLFWKDCIRRYNVIRMH